MRKLLENIKGGQDVPLTEFSYKREKNMLYIHFKAYDSTLFSYSDKDNGELFNGDVVELFLDFGEESYLEIEVSPNGKKFVATILNRAITFIDDSFFKHQVNVEKNSYYVDMMIDLNKFNNPKKIKYNAYRIEVYPDSRVILMAINPTLSNTFHVRNKFIDLLDEE